MGVSPGPVAPGTRRLPPVARVGALVWLVAALQFVVAMAVAQLGWTTPYSLTQNFISDLGAIHCGFISTRYVCSPWHEVFNVSIILFGLLLIVGMLLLGEVFPRRPWATFGPWILIVAGIGAAGVGAFPEDYNLTAHSISALSAFVLANVGVIVLGFALRPRSGRRYYRAYSVVSGSIGLAALLLDLGGAYKWGGFFAEWGVGGMERTIMVPALVWLVVLSVALLRGRAFRPRGSAMARPPGAVAHATSGPDHNPRVVKG
jgi:hypothetical membrane protein